MITYTVCGNTSFTSHSATDDLGRKNFDEVQTGIGFITRQFTYHKGKVTDEHKNNEKIMSGPVTNLVKRIVMSDGRILSYEYDKEERIRKVSESDKSAPDTVVSETVYTYDSLGQLIKETRDGVVINEMTYDKYGNIKTRNGIAYTYGNSVWKDQLTGYGDKSISYDSQGNPVSYLGHTLTWEKGRQLKKYDSNTYTYNANGIRTGKTVSGVKHSYRLEGTKILSEKWGNNTLTPLYDNRDEVCGIVFNGASYYFLKNLQGDVISILDSGRNRVAEYLYDAWGVCTVVNDETEEGIAEVNPFRYRSYYYDSETGIYYLQSRYYDPVVGRFINADDVQILGTSEIVLGYNLFAYCENNPVIYHDPDGYFVITTTMLICAGIGALVFGTIGGIVGYQLSKKWKVPKGKRWKYVLGGVVIGAVSGALIGGAIGYVIGPSTSSGIVLWSGAGNSNVFQAACSFAEKNGLKVLEKTFRGRILNYMQKAAVKLLGKERAWEFMRPLWQAASEQFAKTGQGVVHVFINSSGINFESTFLTIEYWIVRDLGINIVIHLID